VKKVGPEINGHRLVLRVNPDIARALKERKKRAVAEETYGSRSARTSPSSQTSSSSRTVRCHGRLI